MFALILHSAGLSPTLSFPDSSLLKLFSASEEKILRGLVVLAGHWSVLPDPHFRNMAWCRFHHFLAVTSWISHDLPGPQFPYLLSDPPAVFFQSSNVELV